MAEEQLPHMVQQIIKYSDGTETVINYRGRIVDGVLIPDEPEEVKKEKEAKPKTTLKSVVKNIIKKKL